MPTRILKIDRDHGRAAWTAGAALAFHVTNEKKARQLIQEMVLEFASMAPLDGDELGSSAK